MSERIQDKMGMKMERGEFTGGEFAPYGFDFGEGHWLEYSVQEEDANGHIHTKIKRKRSNTRQPLLENPVEQDRLRQMAAWRESGLSYTKIAAEANRLGWPTKTGRSPWQAGNIAGVLQTKHTKRLLSNIPADDRQGIDQIDGRPTGKSLQLRSKHLKPGGSYRHRGGLAVRTIDAIHGNTVYWHDHVGKGHCTKQTFLKLCISIATDQDFDQVQESVQELAVSRDKQEQDEESRRRVEAFLKLCVDANKTNITHVVIGSPSELGMTYDEIMHNLSVLEKYRLYLRIIRPTPTPSFYVYRPSSNQIRAPAVFSQEEIENLKIPAGFEAAHTEWIKQGAPKRQYRTPSYYESLYLGLGPKCCLRAGLP